MVTVKFLLDFNRPCHGLLFLQSHRLHKNSSLLGGTILRMHSRANTRQTLTNWWELIHKFTQFFPCSCFRFMLTSFYTRYDGIHFVFNSLSLLGLSLVPKFPQMYKVRLFGLNKYWTKKRTDKSKADRIIYAGLTKDFRKLIMVSKIISIKTVSILWNWNLDIVQHLIRGVDKVI